MKHKLKFILPPLVLVLAVVTAVGMIKARKPAPKQPPETPPPLVRVVPAAREDHTFVVRSQGTVTPLTEITLVAEVSGRVTRVSPSFEPGGFFEADEPLLHLDPLDHEAAVEQARVTLRQAERRLAEEEAQADIARREWDRVGDGEPTPLTLREPQLAEARALVASAAKALEQAERNLDRTRIRLPYAGRVRSKLVDVGQFVSRGTPVAVIYAVDYAEIRLPITGSDLAYLDLPLGSPRNPGNDGPQVVLETTLAGRRPTWTGTVVRTEGEIDPRTRLIHTVARVEDPYGRKGPGGQVPLAAGLFVEAEITGKTVKDVVVLPRAALRGADELLVVDDDRRLRVRRVEVLRAEEDIVVIASGLEAGELVSLSPMDVVVEGMKVRIPDDPPAPEPETERDSS